MSNPSQHHYLGDLNTFSTQLLQQRHALSSGQRRIEPQLSAQSGVSAHTQTSAQSGSSFGVTVTSANFPGSVHLNPNNLDAQPQLSAASGQLSAASGQLSAASGQHLVSGPSIAVTVTSVGGDSNMTSMMDGFQLGPDLSGGNFGLVGQGQQERQRGRYEGEGEGGALSSGQGCNSLGISSEHGSFHVGEDTVEEHDNTNVQTVTEESVTEEEHIIDTHIEEDEITHTCTQEEEHVQVGHQLAEEEEVGHQLAEENTLERKEWNEDHGYHGKLEQNSDGNENHEQDGENEHEQYCEEQNEDDTHEEDRGTEQQPHEENNEQQLSSPNENWHGESSSSNEEEVEEETSYRHIAPQQMMRFVMVELTERHARSLKTQAAFESPTGSLTDMNDAASPSLADMSLGAASTAASSRPENAFAAKARLRKKKPSRFLEVDGDNSPVLPLGDGVQVGEDTNHSVASDANASDDVDDRGEVSADAEAAADAEESARGETGDADGNDENVPAGRSEDDVATGDEDEDEAARAQAFAERDAAVAARDRAFAERAQAFAERAQAFALRDQVVAARAEAFARRDEAVAARADAFARRDQAVAERDEAVAARDQAILHGNSHNNSESSEADQRQPESEYESQDHFQDPFSRDNFEPQNLMGHQDNFTHAVESQAIVPEVDTAAAIAAGMNTGDTDRTSQERILLNETQCQDQNGVSHEEEQGSQTHKRKRLIWILVVVIILTALAVGIPLMARYTCGGNGGVDRENRESQKSYGSGFLRSESQHLDKSEVKRSGNVEDSLVFSGNDDNKSAETVSSDRHESDAHEAPKEGSGSNNDGNVGPKEKRGTNKFWGTKWAFLTVAAGTSAVVLLLSAILRVTSTLSALSEGDG